MILPVLGLLVGVAVGMLSPITVPLAYAKLSSVALLASLDSVFGGLRAAVAERAMALGFDGGVAATVAGNSC